MKIFMQIGANVGNDSFQEYVSRIQEPCHIILIEANKKCIRELMGNYKKIRSKIKKVNIFNIGIVPRRMKSNILYLYDNSELSSTLVRKSMGASLHKIKFRPYAFNQFCNRLGIKDIEFLMIDIEGLDYEILLDIDLGEINIKKIVFEIWPHDDDDEMQLFRSGENILPLILSKFHDYEHTPEFGHLNSICLVKK